MNILDKINKCYCVNLLERTDRWTKTQAEFKKFNKEIPNIELVRVDAIKDIKNPKYGLNRTITNIIREAKERNDEILLFTEDDIEFLNVARLKETLNLDQVPTDWDVLSGGSYQARDLNVINDYWATTRSFCSMHFIIMKHTMFDIFLEGTGCPELKHIDRWMEEMMRKNNKKYYLMNPMLVRQYPGYSDLRKTVVNDNKRHNLNWYT